MHEYGTNCRLSPNKFVFGAAKLPIAVNDSQSETGKQKNKNKFQFSHLSISASTVLGSKTLSLLSCKLLAERLAIEVFSLIKKKNKQQPAICRPLASFKCCGKMLFCDLSAIREHSVAEECRCKRLQLAPFTFIHWTIALWVWMHPGAATPFYFHWTFFFLLKSSKQEKDACRNRV